MDKWAELRAFAAVVEHQGFAAAAREVGMAPSGVSRLVANLEARLGLRLLNRTTRRVALTDAGARYHQTVRELIAGVETAEAELAGMSLSPKGRLRVSCVVTLAQRWLPYASAEFLRRHPGVALEIIETDQPVDLVEAGVDLALVTGPLKDSSHIVRRLSAFQRVVAAAPGYLDRAGRPRTPEELKRHNCLAFSGAPKLQKWSFQRADGRAQTVTVTGGFAAAGAETILSAAIAGVGVARLATFMVEAGLRSGALEELLKERRSAAAVPLSAVVPAGRQPTPATRVFLEHLARDAPPAFA